MVDVVVAYVVDLREGGVEGLEGWEVGGESGAFSGEEGGGVVDGAEEGDAAAILV